MANFEKVDFMNSLKGRVDLSESEVSVVVTGTKTPNYILINNAVTKDVCEKGYYKLNVYCNSENKTLGFQFGKTGDLIVRRDIDGSKKTSWRISNKQLVEYVMKFFDILPGDNGHHKLTITDNKAQGSVDYLMYYIRKTGMTHVNFD